ncbi:transposase [Streptomyces parvulus]|uniref:transposase n=1 Tax=Streptomyces parvulus TaxID=146923 RepID=UPI003EBA6A99
MSAANTHDSQALEPLVRGIPAHPLPPRTAPTTARQAPWRQGVRLPPPSLVATLPERHPTHRPQGHRILPALGRHRWTVERTVAWLAGCRRLHRRYERKAEHFLAFAGIAAALICYRRLAA